jgi:nucleoside-diphosphate-sugar epimerase
MRKRSGRKAKKWSEKSFKNSERSFKGEEENNMKIFLTGATGFIGSAIVPELIGAGYQVLGLTRSDAGAESLRAAGAEAHYGSLEDLESLRTGAAMSDGVIHCAFIHDFSKFQENCEIDKRAIEALGSVLAGSARPLIVTSGTSGLAAPGQVATEDSAVPPDHPLPRVSEQTALSLKGVSAATMRLPQVHDTVKQGLVTYLIAIAREKGVSAYVGEGRNRWAAAHVSDVARLYRLALQKHEAGAKYHAVAEEGVPMRDIAESIGRGLKIPAVSLSPEEAPAHFGWLAMFAGRSAPASSALTQQRLGWRPTGPGLIADLEKMNYFETAANAVSAAPARAGR